MNELAPQLDPVLEKSLVADRRFWLIVLFVQITFYVFAMPVPQLLGYQSMIAGIVVSFVSCLALVGIPWLAFRFLVSTDNDSKFLLPPESLGLTLGDRQFGWTVTMVAVPAMAIGTFVGGEDAQIQSFYPIVGAQVGQSFLAMLAWLPFMALYYVAFEVFYRGILMNPVYHSRPSAKQTGMPDRLAMRWILIQTAFCCLVHIGKPNIELLACLPASIFFGWLAWRSRSIWYGVLIHFAVGIANDIGALWHSGNLNWLPT